MSGIKLNPAQQEFVKIVDTNVLVSASAGSGKTTTMITKVVDLVANKKVPLKNLLIVTYTNSAASELKVKLYNRLSEKAKECDDETLVDFLNDQLEDINTCEIGTLHSVCKKIIKKYFYVIEQDSTFSLLDEKTTSYLFGQAVNNVFKKLISTNDENFYLLYTSFNAKRSTTTLASIVDKIYNFLCSKIDKQQWIDYVKDSVYDTDLDKNICVKYLVDKFKAIFAEIKKDLMFLYDKTFSLDEKYTKYIEDRLNFCKQICYVENYKQFINIVNEELSSKPRTSTKTTLEEKMFMEECEDVLVEFSYELGEAKKFAKLIDGEQLKQVKTLICNLFDVVKLVSEEYSRLKTERGSLDFSDLEEKTLEILKNEDVVKGLKSNYKYIFVDEYQDINEIQENIIQKLSSGDNINFIGDVKQSIYEFRLSNPKLFLEKYDKYSHGVGGKVVNLNENYRSEENILYFVNFIFDELITNKTLGISYKDSSRLVKGGEESGNKVVKLDVINAKPDLDDVEVDEVLSNDDVEAQLICKNVIDLLGKPYKVGDTIKHVEYKDIAILLRSKKDLAYKVFTRLKAENIPCDASFRNDIFKSSEINQLMSILKVLSNSHNDIACATVLKSPLFKLTEQELVNIRKIAVKDAYYACVEKYVVEGENAETKQKLVNYKDFIEKYRFYLYNHTVLETLEQIFKEYSLKNHYYSLPDGVEKEGNIKQFFSLLNNEELKHDLTKCIEFLEKTAKSSMLVENESGSANSVKIMTMHASKGLEFPAVVVGGLGKSFLINKFTNDLIINDTYGVGVKFLDPAERVENETLVRMACKYANKKSFLDEEIRLLYVALTRPKNYLCCVGTYDVKNAVKNKQKDVYMSKNYLDLMFKSFSNEELYALQNKDAFVINENLGAECGVRVFEKTGFVMKNDAPKDVILQNGDADIVQKLKKLHNYVYPYEQKTSVAIKNSVSSILREENDYENVVFAPKKLSLFESAGDKKSLFLGTMYHEIMQNINYDESIEDIRKIISFVSSKEEYKDVKNLLKEAEIITCAEYLKPLVKDAKVGKEIMFLMQDKHENMVVDGVSEDVMVQGVIDMVIEKGDDVYIIDFKTNKFFKDEDLIETYATQLSLYAKAYENAYNKKVTKLLLYSFSKNKFIEVPKKVLI